MKKLIVILVLLIAVPAWAITVTLDAPYVIKKPAVKVRMDTMTISPGAITVPLEYIDVDGKVVYKTDFRIINNPPIYSYNMTTNEITGILTPGDTDFDDIINYPIPTSYVGKGAYSPMVFLVKQYILNALGVTGN